MNAKQGATDSIPLILERAAPLAGRVPVTFGLPLPRGAFPKNGNWCIRFEDGSAETVQTSALELWPDGSPRWLLVDAQFDVTRASGARLELLRDRPQTGPGASLTIDQSADLVAVDTGVLRVALRPGSTLLDAATAAGRPAIDAPATGLYVTDEAGQTAIAHVTALHVVVAGPLRARVAADLRLSQDSLRELALRAVLDFYGGSSVIRIAVRVRNPRPAVHAGGFWDLGDPGSYFIKDLSLRVAPPNGVQATSFEVSLEDGSPGEKRALPFELYQESSGGTNWQSPVHVNRHRRVPMRFRGYRVRSTGAESSGLRATPVVQLAHAAGAIGAAVPEFWQNCPRALEADTAGLVLRVFPQQHDDLHELQGGEQKTHTCYVALAGEPGALGLLEWCRNPLVVRTNPEWYRAAEAVPFLGPIDPAQASLVNAAIEGPESFVAKREVVDEYGWRHFGEIYADHEAIGSTTPLPLVSHYNNQYDPVGGFLQQFFRTGDVRWWTQARDLARHVIDIDVYHTTRDKSAYNGGLFWHTYHYGEADTSTHRTYPRVSQGRTHGGGPSPQHNYTTGLLLYYLLTGEEDARDTAVGLAQYVVDADDGSKTPFRWLSLSPTGVATASETASYHGPGRGSGNSLNALLDGHRLTGDVTFLDKADAVVRRVVHPDDDIGRHNLEDPERRWFYLMFLQSLGKYLWYRRDRGRLDAMYAYGRASLLHYARWMARHEYPYLEKPEKLEHPTESWAAHEARKSDVLCQAALHATGAERQKFLERARFFSRYATTTLASMPTRTLARPVIVLLSSGLVLPWLAEHPEATAPPPAEPVAVFPPQQPFVPQKTIATRRAVLLAAVAAIGLAAALTALIWQVLS